MDDSIITREAMRARGKAARSAGKIRDEHGMNPGAAAIVEWQIGWGEEDARLRDTEQLEAA